MSLSTTIIFYSINMVHQILMMLLLIRVLYSSRGCFIRKWSTLCMILPHEDYIPWMLFNSYLRWFGLIVFSREHSAQSLKLGWDTCMGKPAVYATMVSWVWVILGIMWVFGTHGNTIPIVVVSQVVTGISTLFVLVT
jgi:hypothetical protein